MVVPCYKKGDKFDINNYHPVALIPVVSKVLECIIKNQLQQFFVNNHILTIVQFGFRINLSTIKTVGSIVFFVLKGFENMEKIISLL